MTLSSLCALLLLAAPDGGRAIAILPPVPMQGADAWLGMAVADNLEARLLRHAAVAPSAKKKGKGKRRKGGSPEGLSVFSWRQSLSAARAEGLDTRRPLSADEVNTLAGQLGARYVFVGSYALEKKNKKSKILFKWRLVDTQSKRPAKLHRVKASVGGFAAKTERLAVDLLRALGEKPAGKRKPTPDSLAKVPLTAISAYAKGIAILGRQSLDPWAKVVLPGQEIVRAHVLFESATEAAPALRRAWIGRAMASAMLGDTPAAVTELEKAGAPANATDPLAALGLYYVKVRAKEAAAARDVLTAAVDAHPGFLAGLGYLGKAHFRAEKPAEALAVFERYRARVPNSPWVRLMKARALSYLGRHDEAIAEARAVQGTHGDSVMVATNLAARLTQAGKYEAAQEVLEKALAQHRAHPALLTRLSYVELTIGSVGAALELAQKAVAELEKGRGETLAGYAYANLGHALALSDRKAEAKAAFEKAAALGISIDDRQLLERDDRVQEVVGASALAKDEPPPPPPPPPPLPEAEVAELTRPDDVAQEAEAEAKAEAATGTVEEEAWEEAESFEEDEDWDDDWEEEGDADGGEAAASPEAGAAP